MASTLDPPREEEGNNKRGQRKSFTETRLPGAEAQRVETYNEMKAAPGLKVGKKKGRGAEQSRAEQSRTELSSAEKQQQRMPPVTW